MDFLKGYKTYIAAAGLLGLAVYQFSQGDIDGAIQNVLAAFAAFGMRQAISRPVEIVNDTTHKNGIAAQRTTL
jgi:hypothetical protein